MKLVPFVFLTLLSLIYAGVTLAETMTYRKWEQAIYEQKVIQEKVSYYQRMNSVLDQLIRRMAYESQRDPAMARLLAEHRIKVVIGGPKMSPYSTTTDTNTNSPSNAAPAPTSPSTPDAPSPAATTPSHP